MSTRLTMSTNFATNLLLALASGWVIVALFAFSTDVSSWIVFGVTGVGALTLVAVASVLPRRGYVQRGLDLAVAAIAIWTIVESLVFDGTSMKWISVGGACGMLVLAVAGLAYHELRTEHVVHTLESSTAERPPVETYA